MSNNFFTSTPVEKPVRIPGKRMGITKQMILNAQSKTKSNMEAARWLEVSYNTYKKWAKRFGIFEQHLNQEGVGIKKSYSYVINPNAKKYKYFNPITGKPNYGSGVYVIGLPYGKIRDNFVNKYGAEPYKIGWGKNVEERATEVLLKYYPKQLPKTKMWKEWLDKAEPIGYFKYRSVNESKVVEKATHKRLEGYSMGKVGSAIELFNISADKLYKILFEDECDFRTENWCSNKLVGYDYEDKKTREFKESFILEKNKEYEKKLKKDIKEIKENFLEIEKEKLRKKLAKVLLK